MATEPKAVAFAKMMELTLNPATIALLGTVGEGRAHEDESKEQKSQSIIGV